MNNPITWAAAFALRWLGLTTIILTARKAGLEPVPALLMGVGVMLSFEFAAFFNHVDKDDWRNLK